ncbi:MAG: hypothetical protein ABW252_11040 [Polyangiales bacterium]
MDRLIRHGFGALVLLTGCATSAEHAPSEARQEIAAESDISENIDAPAAQIVPGASAACAAGTARAPASGLRIREVALYQTIKVPLVQNGAWVSARPVMVVQNKRALVRVFVDAIAGYRPRPLRGTLTLQNGGTSTELVSARSLTASSTDEAPDSTFTFDVPAAQIGPSTQLSIALTEPECSSAAPAAAADTRFPASGLQALGANQTGKLKVVLVPISVAGRAPQITETDLNNVRDVLLSYYPVPTVEVSVRNRPLVWSTAVTGADSRAWSSIVNALVRERGTDRPSSDTYYYGVMQPAATMATFCSRGCIAGMAPQNTRVQPSTQVGLSVFYPGGSAAAMVSAAEIIVHELGHAHGRGHAPCVTGNGTIQGVDRNYPVTGGNIGTWGWNSRTGVFNAPTHKDVMGYCRPNWISAYTYQALALRSQSVNINRAFIHMPGPSVRWQNLIAYSDGTNRWGGTSELGAPGGDPEPARVLDAAGNVIDDVEVVRTELSHTADEFFFIPEPGKDWAKLALRDREIVLSDVAAPL